MELSNNDQQVIAAVIRENTLVENYATAIIGTESYGVRLC